MAHGLKIWDSGGNVIFDTSTRVGRVIGTVNTGTTPGEVTGVTAFSQGTPFYFIIPLSTGYNVIPTVTISGTTISWHFNGGISSNQVCQLHYGVF